jgi:hypothetical protein
MERKDKDHLTKQGPDGIAGADRRGPCAIQVERKEEGRHT